MDQQRWTAYRQAHEEGAPPRPPVRRRAAWVTFWTLWVLANAWVFFGDCGDPDSDGIGCGIVKGMIVLPFLALIGLAAGSALLLAWARKKDAEARDRQAPPA